MAERLEQKSMSVLKTLLEHARKPMWNRFFRQPQKNTRVTELLLNRVCRRSERGYLVCILASHPGVPGSNPIAAPKSLVMD